MTPQTTRHYMLDLLRFLAALVVVVWHYQHFYYTSPGMLPDSHSAAQSPFFEQLKPLYYYGGRAVEFFFVLSGFIFFWLYHDRISTRSVSFGKFFNLRFSRLYPLHFATLIFVALMQFIAVRTTGDFVVYPVNDLWHFVLHLAFASHWGMEEGWSFNAPVWSVSVEILLYAVFFTLALLVRRPVLSIMLGLGLGIVCAVLFKEDTGWGLICFFLGGLVYLLYEQLGRAKIAAYLRATGLAGLAALILALAYHALSGPNWMRDLLLFAAVFPMVVFFIAALQREFPSLGQSSSVLGELSYAVYLLHFPLQLVILLMVKTGVIHIDFGSELFFCFFFAALVGLSYLVHIYFELPAKSWLRRALEAKVMG